MEKTSSKMQNPAKTLPSSESTHSSKNYGCITGSVHLPCSLPLFQDELPLGGTLHGYAGAPSGLISPF